MKIIITVKDETACELNHQANTSPPTSGLLATLKKNGAKVTPFQSNAGEPALQNYFIVHTEDDTTAPDLLDELQKSPAVMSAYIKPADEAPL